jgi:hypothetical protein
MNSEVSDMADSGIKVRIEGEIAYIALNRPEKRNAINQAMLRAIPDAIVPRFAPSSSTARDRRFPPASISHLCPTTAARAVAKAAAPTCSASGASWRSRRDR